MPENLFHYECSSIKASQQDLDDTCPSTCDMQVLAEGGGTTYRCFCFVSSAEECAALLPGTDMCVCAWKCCASHAGAEAEADGGDAWVDSWVEEWADMHTMWWW